MVQSRCWKVSLISLVTLLTFSFSSMSCALLRSSPRTQITLPVEKSFLATYDEVWAATLKVLNVYPIQNNNVDLGIIETSTIKGYQYWAPPDRKEDPPAGLRYKLAIRVIKGSVSKKKVTRVIVEKKIELYRDFFSDAEKLKSDGLEELGIMYRIQREIIIQRAVQKAFKKQQQEP